jgi:hypothetical protein
MAALIGELDEVQLDADADGETVRRQLERRVWERRGWATVAAVYEERAPSGEWKPPKLALVRLRKVHEAWRKEAAITLGAEDARGLAEVLAAWRGRFDPAQATENGSGGGSGSGSGSGSGDGSD